MFVGLCTYYALEVTNHFAFVIAQMFCVVFTLELLLES